MEKTLPLGFRIEQCTDVEAAPTFAAIGQSTFSETFGHLYHPSDLHAFLTTKHSVAYYRDLLGDLHTGLWLLWNCEDIPVGYAVCGPCTLPVPDLPTNSGELSRLYLTHTAQGQGLGTIVLEQCLAWLETRFHNVYISVYSENIGAQRLYAQFGFQKIHDYQFMVGNHADPEWILKRIDP